MAYQATQPPSGGCVLKLERRLRNIYGNAQPPSGGCVLKPVAKYAGKYERGQPPSGGCVLKQRIANDSCNNAASRLQAAVC